MTHHRKSLLTLAVIVLVTALIAITTSCGKGGVTVVPVVQAAPAPPPPPPTPASITPVYGAREYPGSYIALVNPPSGLLGDPNETDTQSLVTNGQSNPVSITTSADIHVHAIRLWIGAGVWSTFETGVNLEIIPPGGPGAQGYKRFTREWDKHVEEHFQDQPFAVDFVIPAGYVVRLSRDPHTTVSCMDGVGGPNPIGHNPGNCATQEMAELWGN